MLSSAAPLLHAAYFPYEDAYMGKSLIIVESPAKVKTIKKFLGPGYVVQASVGHIRDLPKSSIGVQFMTYYASAWMVSKLFGV